MDHAILSVTHLADAIRLGQKVNEPRCLAEGVRRDVDRERAIALSPRNCLLAAAVNNGLCRGRRVGYGAYSAIRVTAAVRRAYSNGLSDKRTSSGGRDGALWYTYCMETIRKITEIDPQDLPVVERMFGQRLEVTANVVLVLRTPDVTADSGPTDSDELPAWCNVLDGMSDEDRDDFRATLRAFRPTERSAAAHDR